MNRHCFERYINWKPKYLICRIIATTNTMGNSSISSENEDGIVVISYKMYYKMNQQTTDYTVTNNTGQKNLPHEPKCQLAWCLKTLKHLS